MFDDVIFQLSNCHSAVCLGWHAAMLTGGLAFGLWLAHEFWGRQDDAPPVPAPPARLTPQPKPEPTSDSHPEADAGPLKSYLRATESSVLVPSSNPPSSTLGELPSCPYEFDLTLVRGINHAIGRGLREEGIVSLRDLATCPRGKWQDITGLLLLGDLPIQEHWQDQARELLRHVDAIAGRRRLPAPQEISQELIGEWFAGERVIPHDTLGPVFDAMPLLVDRLSEIDGITPAISLALGSMGIWRFKQVGLWTVRQVDEVSRRLNIPPTWIEESAWISRAMLRHLDSYRGSPIWALATPEGWQYEELMNQYPVSDFIQADPTYGVVYLERPSAADNLTQIRGIDALTAESLRHAGIQRFRQIADWSEANVDAFTNRLRLVPGRIYTERWIPQANGLCDGRSV